MAATSKAGQSDASEEYAGESDGDGLSSTRMKSKATNSDFTKAIQLLDIDDRYDLYQALDINDRDIQTAELDAPRGAGVDLQAKYVLFKWRKDNSKKATRQALLDGLEKCGNIEAKEILEEIWNGRDVHKRSESELYDIIEPLGSEELLRLYRQLGLSQTEVERAESRSKGSGVHQKARSVIRWWMKRNGKKATSERLQEAVNRCTSLPVPDTGSEALDVSQCRKELEHHYLQSLCKIPLIPGDKSSYVNMDDVYTDLSILVHLPKLGRPLVVPLKSHHEIFTRATSDPPSYRLLVLGNPGCGKYILTLKLAYDWAVKNPESPLKDVPLLFALNMRWMTPETTLVDAIFQQSLLPKDTKITKSSLRHYIEKNQSSCVILFDSYDEYGFSEHFSKMQSDTHDILLNDSLRQCRVLVTSRFWKAKDFDDLRDVYTQIEIGGFSAVNVEKYIFKFFSDDPSNAEKLLRYLEDHNLNPGLANVPLMTVLFCLCWKDSGGEHIPRKISNLYDVIFRLLHRQYVTKTASKSINLDNLVTEVGRVAFSGLWTSDDAQEKLVFNLPEFVEKASKLTVINGCRIGLLSVEYRSTGSFMTLLNDDNNHKLLESASYWTNINACVTYFHKSCQEKCTGKYLANMYQTEHDNFTSKLKLLKTAKMCMRLELVLRFACGASNEVPAAILQQLQEVFRVEFSPIISDYYEELLHPDKAKVVQDFIELCLLCYYESSLKSTTHLQELFPEGQMLFIGMPQYTSNAIGQFMSANVIKSIAIKAVPTQGNVNNVKGVIRNAYDMISRQLKRLPQETLRRMYEHEMIDDDRFAFSTLRNAEAQRYFKDWQSSRTFNFDNLFNCNTEISSTTLQSLKLVGVKLGNQMDKLQTFIDRGCLMELSTLDLHSSGLSTVQVNKLLCCIQYQLPNLEWLDISGNVPVRMYNLGDRIADTKISTLLVHKNGARIEDMANLIHNIPRFGSRMRILTIGQNAIDDESGQMLAKYMPCLNRLQNMSLMMYRMTNATHNEIVKALRHLPSLACLQIDASWFLDDLLNCVSQVLLSLPAKIVSVKLASSAVVDQKRTFFPDPLPQWVRGRSNQTIPVQRSVSKAFIASLDAFQQLVHVDLVEIPLHKEDVVALLECCKRRGCEHVGYSKSMFPEDMDPLEYGFLDLIETIFTPPSQDQEK